MTASVGPSDVVPGKPRSSRPRQRTVVLSLRRGVLGWGIVALVALSGLSFFLGYRSSRPAVPVVHEVPLVPPPAQVLSAARPTGVSMVVSSDPVVPEVLNPEGVEGAPPPPSAPPVVKRKSPKKGYGIQLGAFVESEAAETFVMDHADAFGQHPIFLLTRSIRGKGVWHRVRLGVFEEEDEAEAVRVQLPADLREGTILVQYR